MSGLAAGKIGSSGAKKPPEVKDMIANNVVRNWNDYARNDHMRHFGYQGWRTWMYTGILDFSYGYQLTQGLVSVLEGLKSPPAIVPPVCEDVTLEVEFRTDERPLENWWTLTGTGICNGGYRYSRYPENFFTDENYQSVEKLCVPPGPYKMEVVDEGGDGIGMGRLWNEQGHYKVTWNDEVLAQGKDIGAGETTLFSTKECPPCEGKTS